MKNKALLLSIISILIMTLSLSYAFFYYKESLNDISLSSGEISINFDVDNNSYNALLEHTKSDPLGKIDYNYYDFTVSGNISDEFIYYEIQIKETAGNTLDTKYLKVYLTDQDDHEIIGPLLLSELGKNGFNNNKIVYTSYLFSSIQEYKYRLRLWISDDYELGASQTFSFKIVLYARNSETKEVPANKYIVSRLGNDGLVAVKTDGTLYSGSGTIREYRYSGGSPNNYIYFNGNELWRIVGVFDGELKIIKDIGISGVPTSYTNNNSQRWTDKLGTSSTNADGSQQIYWNGTQYGTNQNDWTTAGLMYYLNEKTNTNSYYYNLNSSYKSLIDSSTIYYLGNVDVYTNEVTPSDVYNQERNTESTNIWSGNQETWSGSSTLAGIGLLYPSDFGYAADTSTWTNSRTNLSGTTASNNWLNNSSIYNWTISPAKNYNYSVMVFRDCVRYAHLHNTISVRPVLHLISTAQIDIAQGNGSLESPYVIVIN